MAANSPIDDRQPNAPLLSESNGAIRFFLAHRSDILSLGLLSLILMAGLYLRLANLTEWFNYFNDYDEGTYVLAAKLLSEGKLPYRDFTLVQPPLYQIMLAAVFKLFHYDFMIARYLSVAVSLFNIILVFAIARRTFGSLPAVIAGSIFAFDPLLVYLGRRGVIDSFGLFFCLFGLLLLTFYLSDKSKRWLAGVGVAFGLALAAKLIYVPLIFGVIVAVAALQSGLSWRSIAKFGTTKALGEYLGVMAFIFAVVVFMKVLGVNLSLQVFEYNIQPQNVLVGFILLFAPAFFVFLWHTDSSALRDLASGIVRAVRSQDLWILVGVTVLTFFIVLAPFLLIAPKDVINQIVLLQINRSGALLPTYLAHLTIFIYTPGLLRLYVLPILASAPILYLLLRYRSATSMHFILVIGLAGALVGLQLTLHIARYYISVYPFLALGVAALFTGTARSLTKGIFLAAVVLLLAGLSLRVTTVFQGYDIADTFQNPPGDARYAEVATFITNMKPNAKVYSPSPALLALSPELQAVPNFDTFGRLWLADDTTSQFLDDVLKEDIDFIVLGPWVRTWRARGIYAIKAASLQEEVMRRGTLVHSVGVSDRERFDIYVVRPTPDH